jgi:hypothetical protein
MTKTDTGDALGGKDIASMLFGLGKSKKVAP